MKKQWKFYQTEYAAFYKENNAANSILKVKLNTWRSLKI